MPDRKHTNSACGQQVLNTTSFVFNTIKQTSCNTWFYRRTVENYTDFELRHVKQVKAAEELNGEFPIGYRAYRHSNLRF